MSKQVAIEEAQILANQEKIRFAVWSEFNDITESLEWEWAPLAEYKKFGLGLCAVEMTEVHPQ